MQGKVTAPCSGHTSSEQAQNNDYLSPDKEFQVYLPLPAGERKSKLSFGLGPLSQVFCPFQTELTVPPSVPISKCPNFLLVCLWPHRIKSPSLAFDPLINNSSPALRAVTPWKELDTRLLDTRMLGLPMEFGTGQLLSCQNQYLDKTERGCIKNG